MLFHCHIDLSSGILGERPYTFIIQLLTGLMTMESRTRDMLFPKKDSETPTEESKGPKLNEPDMDSG